MPREGNYTDKIRSVYISLDRLVIAGHIPTALKIHVHFIAVPFRDTFYPTNPELQQRAHRAQRRCSSTMAGTATFTRSVDEEGTVTTRS
jgi:hypothetical protein